MEVVLEETIENRRRYERNTRGEGDDVTEKERERHRTRVF